MSVGVRVIQIYETERERERERERDTYDTGKLPFTLPLASVGSYL